MKTLLSIPQLASRVPFSESAIRGLITREHQNGLAKSGALIRSGRRVLIDENLFEQWLSVDRKATPNASKNAEVSQ